MKPSSFSARCYLLLSRSRSWLNWRMNHDLNPNQAAANTCYEQLTAAGIKVHTAWQYDDYMYNHQKFWIVDGERLGLSTGNWSPTDFPGGGATFPTHEAGGDKWRRANRDFNVKVSGAPDVVAVYQAVIDGDMKNAVPWKGGHSPHGGGSCKTLGCEYVKGRTGLCQCDEVCLFFFRFFFFVRLINNIIIL